MAKRLGVECLYFTYIGVEKSRGGEHISVGNLLVLGMFGELFQWKLPQLIASKHRTVFTFLHINDNWIEFFGFVLLP